VTISTPDADLRRAFAFLAPYWRRLVLVMAISLVSTGLSLVTPYLSKDLVDQALIGRDLTALIRIVGVFAALGVASYVLNVVSGLRYTRVSAAILFDMRLAVYTHLQQLSPRFYARTRLGDIVSRLNSDIGEIQRVAAEAALAWVGNVLFLVGCVAMLLWLDWRLALVTAAIMPLSLWTLVRYRRRLEARVADLRQRSADIGSFLIETLQASTLIVTSNAQARERSRFQGLNDRFVAALMGMQQLTYLAGGLPGLIVSLGASVVFLYGGARVIDGTLTLGTFAAFIAYQMRVMAPVQALMGLYTSLATAKVSWRRVLQLLDAPLDVREPAGAHALPAVRGVVEFDAVSVTTERGVPVLDGFSLRVEPGTSVAIVGASGSGKSTLAHLLLRLLDPDAGVVRLDGHDLKTLRLGTSAGTWCWSSRSRRCCTRRSPTTSATPVLTPTTRRWRWPPMPPGCAPSSSVCRKAWARWSASAASSCRLASGSAWRSPGRFSPIRRYWSSTSRRRRSTRCRSGMSSTATRR
jgi:ATP-binding cassette subfamily B protein